MMKKAGAETLLQHYGALRAALPFFLSRPLGWFLYITARCNLRCSYCWQREEEARDQCGTLAAGKELSPEEWTKVVARLPWPGFLGISGGEPTLSKAFGPILEAAGRRRFPVTVNTNGLTLGADAVLRRLSQAPVKNISISLDGFAEYHDAARNMPGLFARIVEGVKAFNALRLPGGKPSLTIKTVLLDANAAALPAFREFCAKELQADTLNISLAKHGDHAQYSLKSQASLCDALGEHRAAVLHDYAEKARVLQILSDMMAHNDASSCKVTLFPRIDSRAALAQYLEKGGRTPHAPCRLPWALHAILPDGEVTPCLSLGVGNVRDHEYDARRAAASPLMRSFLEAIEGAGTRLPAACTGCCFSRVRMEKAGGKGGWR